MSTYRLTDDAEETCPDCGLLSADYENGCGYSSTCECETCGCPAYCDGAC